MIEENHSGHSIINLRKRDNSAFFEEKKSNQPRRIVKVNKHAAQLLEVTGTRHCSELLHPKKKLRKYLFSLPTKSHYAFGNTLQCLKFVELENPKLYCLELIAQLKSCFTPLKAKKPKKEKTDTRTNRLKLFFIKYMEGKSADIVKASNLALILNLKYGVARNWLNEYRRGEFQVVKERKRRIVTTNILDFIVNFYSRNKNRFKTLKNLKEEMTRTLRLNSKKICLSTIWKVLRKHKISFKHISIQNENLNTQLRISQRQTFAETMMGLLYSGYTLIFLDETSFHLHTNMRKYGWSRRGKKIIEIGGKKSVNYSVTVAITCTQILGAKVFKGGMRSEDHFSFLLELIKKNPNLNLEQTIIFLDNCSIHKSSKFLDDFKKQMHFIFNVAYSPQLNPIEQFFHLLKMEVRRSNPKTEISLLKPIHDAIINFKEQNLLPCFIESLNDSAKSLKCEPL